MRYQVGQKHWGKCRLVQENVVFVLFYRKKQQLTNKKYSLRIEKAFRLSARPPESSEIESVSAASPSHNLSHILMPRCPPAWHRDAP